jgi:hypothetical protein
MKPEQIVEIMIKHSSTIREPASFNNLPGSDFKEVASEISQKQEEEIKALLTDFYKKILPFLPESEIIRDVNPFIFIKEHEK